jgi:hypothetical protein
MPAKKNWRMDKRRTAWQKAMRRAVIDGGYSNRAGFYRVAKKKYCNLPITEKRFLNALNPLRSSYRLQKIRTKRCKYAPRRREWLPKASYLVPFVTKKKRANRPRKGRGVSPSF